MKKILALALLLIIAFIDTSCKKGDEDPFISFRSRKARLCGKWTVNEGSMDNKLNRSEKYSSSNKIVSTYKNATNSGSYTWNYEFKEDGSYEMTRIINLTDSLPNEIIEKGTWYFLGKNENAKIKNKQYVVLQPSERTYNKTDLASESNSFGDTYEIVELRNKEIKLKKDYSSTTTLQTSTPTTNIMQMELTLTPQ